MYTYASGDFIFLITENIKKMRLFSNKYKPKIKQKSIKTKSDLPSNLQTIKQKLLS